MDIFGFQFSRDDKTDEVLKTIEIKTITDPDAINTSAFYGQNGIMDYNSTVVVPADEIELIKQYRRLSITVELSQILTAIFNEVYVFDVENRRAFDINFYDDSTIPTKIKEKISEELDELYKIANFRKYGLSWFKDWYIDSKFNAQVIIDENKPKKGILGVVPIDPLKLRKVRIIPDEEPEGGFDLNKVQEYFVYNNYFDDDLKYNMLNDVRTSAFTNSMGRKISTDAIIQVLSGERDPETGKTIGFLHKAIVPYNNLKMMEEAMIIFRVVRAPMRRVFYFDVSKMPPQKAKEYMKNQIKEFKTRFVYNSKTGTANSQTHISSMLDDYYLPRASEGRTTEIQNIEGQSSQEIMEEIEYLKDKLWRAGNVPLSRLQQDQGSFVFGRSTEIQREEYNFRKFLNNIRSQFMTLFDELLKRQLILKGIITEQEWKETISGQYDWVYTEDNAFVEWKEAEKMSSRLEQLERITAFSGRFYSDYWISKNILHLTDEEIEEMGKQIKNQPDYKGGQDF